MKITSDLFDAFLKCPTKCYLRSTGQNGAGNAYSESLFTFLRHDNVPWNNNNAEHAVHYFAKVRRFTDGCFTSSSIEELLTLVTVLQTCEYMGVNALQFLLSGGTSLAAMTGPKCKPWPRPSIPSVSSATT